MAHSLKESFHNFLPNYYHFLAFILGAGDSTMNRKRLQTQESKSIGSFQIETSERNKLGDLIDCNCGHLVIGDQRGLS